MARAEKKHLVDGEWITVRQAAEMLGLTRQQIYNQIHHKKCGLQVIVNMVRENLVLNGGASGQRHMVEGKWMTPRQAAEMLGVQRKAMDDWRYRHRHADGSWATLAEAVAAYRSGEVRPGGRRPPVLHRVGRKMMTVREAAEMLGVSENAIRCYMCVHRATLAQTVRHYERRKVKRAEKEIMGILGF